MIRQLRPFVYFFVGVLLSAWVVLAHAETLPATPGANCGTGSYYVSGGGNYCSVAEICTAAGLSLWSVPGSQVQCKNMTTYDDTYYSFAVVQGVPYSCPVGQNWVLNGSMCTRPDCVLPQTRVEATGLCAVPVPTCVGAQFLDAVSNTCKCVVTAPTTKSYQIVGVVSKDPPSCSNACEQSSGGAWGSPLIVCSVNFQGMLNPATRSSTCYAKTGQTGAICDGSGGGGGPVQVTLTPITAPPAPPGVNPSGTADPLTTTPNNGDPSTCGAAGGAWGVFNGKGTCYSPTPLQPVITSRSDISTVTNPLTGAQNITNTTTTQTCTGVGDCSSTTTTSNSTGGGGAGTTVTKTGNGVGGSANVTSDGAGNFKLDLPTDYQRDSTGLILNAKVQDLVDVIGKPVADDSSITSAKHSDASRDALDAAQKSSMDMVKGSTNAPDLVQRSVWEQTMSTSWWEPITLTGCTPFSKTIAGRVWELDHCPTAAKISEFGAYVAWVALMFGAFRMLTTYKPSE